MAIDDPIQIRIDQAEEAVREEAYLPSQLVKVGLSGFVAWALKDT